MVLENRHRLLFNLVFIRGVTDYQTLTGVFGMGGAEETYNPASDIYNRYTAEVLPDFCCNCLTDFGTVVGGRLRVGCPVCRNPNLDGLNSWTMFTQSAEPLKLIRTYQKTKVGYSYGS